MVESEDNKSATLGEVMAEKTPFRFHATSKRILDSIAERLKDKNFTETKNHQPYLRGLLRRNRCCEKTLRAEVFGENKEKQLTYTILALRYLIASVMCGLSPMVEILPDEESHAGQKYQKPKNLPKGHPAK